MNLIEIGSTLGVIPHLNAEAAIAIQRKIKQNDGSNYSLSYIWSVIRGVRRNERILKMYYKIAILRERRDKKVLTIKKNILKADQEYIERINNLKL